MPAWLNADDCDHKQKTAHFPKQVRGTWHWMQLCKSCGTEFDKGAMSQQEIENHT